MLSVKESETRRRQFAYGATLVGVLGGYFLFRDLPWHGSLEFLLSIEWASAILSVCVGAFALIRFYSRKEITFLFIGTGFIVNGMLDGIHAATMSSYSINAASDFPLQQVAWSWYTSRLFLPVLLWLSWYIGKRERLLGVSRISDAFVYVSVTLLALGFYVLFHSGVLPADAFSGSRWGPYREYLPALFLCLAWVGYYREGGWRNDAFQHWLLLAIMTDLMREILLMPVLQQDYGIVFSVAHILNAVSYAFAFIGLLFNMHRLFSVSLAHQELVLKNIILATQQETSLDAILVADEQGMVISYNRRFIDLWRIPDSLMQAGLTVSLLQQHALGQAKDPQAYLARVRQLNEHKWEKGYDELSLKDGRIIDRYSAPMVGRDGRYYGRIWYFRDITEKMRRQQALQESEARFRSLVDLSLVGIALIEEGRFGYVNRKLADIFGYAVEEMMALDPAEMALDGASPAINRILNPDVSLAQASEFTFEGRRKNGEPLHIEGRSVRANFEGKPGLILTLMDVTKQVHAQQEVEKLQGRLLDQAIRDPLTRLYNRRYLDDVIGRELSRAERGGYPLALVMGDIDHFKDINDTYGHPAGDAVLRRFAELLRRHSRGGDILCRYGGEEFVLLLPHMDLRTACDRAERLRQEFAAAEIGYQSAVIRATASFGVAALGAGQCGESLVAAADKALYEAKRSGRNRAACAA